MYEYLSKSESAVFFLIVLVRFCEKISLISLFCAKLRTIQSIVSSTEIHKIYATHCIIGVLQYFSCFGIVLIQLLSVYAKTPKFFTKTAEKGKKKVPWSPDKLMSKITKNYDIGRMGGI